MPGGDRRGPMGAGAMSGRGAGYCSGSGVPGVMNGFVRGCGRGGGKMAAGRGFGFNRNMRYNMPGGVYQISTEEEQSILENEIKILREDLERIQKRLSELKSQNS